MENQKDKEAFLNTDRECFVAQYWGQKCVIYTSEGSRPSLNPWYVDDVKEDGKGTSYLLLKSLENISDEDLIKCYHLHSAQIGYDYTMDFKPVLEMAKHWLENKGLKEIMNSRSCSDYLRSESYLIPFRNYSIEQILSLGWAKIENKYKIM